MIVSLLITSASLQKQFPILVGNEVGNNDRVIARRQQLVTVTCITAATIARVRAAGQ